MRKVSDKEREKLSAEIAGLESLDLNQLRVRWKLLYEIEAPPHLSRDWLRRAVAYRLQENALGGLKPATRRLLERVAEDARVRKLIKVVPMRKVGPNTILIREWVGTRHEVTVVENGVMFRGKRYRSLSQVARMITGSQWSGPLFFGLKAPAKEAGNGSAPVTPSAAARSTRESLQKRVSSGTSIRSMLSAKPARLSSRASRAKAGNWSRPPTMTAVSPVGTWKDLPCSACSKTSATA